MLLSSFSSLIKTRYARTENGQGAKLPKHQDLMVFVSALVIIMLILMLVICSSSLLCLYIIQSRNYRMKSPITLYSDTLVRCIRELELQLQASLPSTHNGSFLWRTPEVARRRRDAIEERITSIYSPPFYTGRYSHTLGHVHTH